MRSRNRAARPKTWSAQPGFAATQQCLAYNFKCNSLSWQNVLYTRATKNISVLLTFTEIFATPAVIDFET